MPAWTLAPPCVPPGDNITVMVVRLRPLPPLPRSTGSRLNLRSTGSGELVSAKLADVSGQGRARRLAGGIGGVDRKWACTCVRCACSSACT